MKTLTTPQLEVYCIECSFSERVSTLAEAGRLMDSHSDGPHECCCYDHDSDRMVNGPAAVAFEESTAHAKQEDCTVDPNTECCSTCGVDHSRECPDCHKRGYHSDTCFLWEPPTFEESLPEVQ